MNCVWFMMYPLFFLLFCNFWAYILNCDSDYQHFERQVNSMFTWVTFCHLITAYQAALLCAICLSSPLLSMFFLKILPYDFLVYNLALYHPLQNALLIHSPFSLYSQTNANCHFFITSLIIAIPILPSNSSLVWVPFIVYPSHHTLLSILQFFNKPDFTTIKNGSYHTWSVRVQSTFHVQGKLSIVKK